MDDEVSAELVGSDVVDAASPVGDISRYVGFAAGELGQDVTD